MSLLLVKTGVITGVILSGYLQLPSTPPMKLGLWESSTTVTTQMPGMNMPPRTYKTRSCVTADSWAKAFGSSQRTADCTRTNEAYSAGHYTFDMTCSQANAKAHGDFDFSGDGKGHGTVHMDMNAGGRQMTSDMVTDSHFVSTDCGTVAPGKPEIMQ